MVMLALGLGPCWVGGGERMNFAVNLIGDYLFSWARIIHVSLVSKTHYLLVLKNHTYTCRAWLRRDFADEYPNP